MSPLFSERLPEIVGRSYFISWLINTCAVLPTRDISRVNITFPFAFFWSSESTTALATSDNIWPICRWYFPPPRSSRNAFTLVFGFCVLIGRSLFFAWLVLVLIAIFLRVVGGLARCRLFYRCEWLCFSAGFAFDCLGRFFARLLIFGILILLEISWLFSLDAFVFEFFSYASSVLEHIGAW